MIEHIRHSEFKTGHPALFQFLDKEIRQGEAHSVRDEYPSLFGDFPGGESLVIQQGDDIVSHVGFLTRNFYSPYYQMKVGIIGSVTTTPPWRRHGFASTLINNAMQELKRRGCMISVLWAEDPVFYESLGFQRAGLERDFRFSADKIPGIDKPAVPYEATKHSPFLWRLYSHHELRVDRSLEEQNRLCRIPQTRIFVTERKGGISSYIAIQKGVDFKNYIHEWGGEPQEIIHNVCWVQKHIFPDASLTLIAPEFYDLMPFRSIAVEEWDGVLGMMKILNRTGLVNLYFSYLRDKKVAFQWNQETQTLKYETRDFELKTELDYLRLIFGNRDPFAPPPLPFFLWGFDSI